jgi:NAD(P)-dependent dehydrogenase (short-subunit alcohol dehydrogenase family)
MRTISAEQSIAIIPDGASLMIGGFMGVGTPSIDDVGVATAFLAHDAARLITGETLYVDGGYHIID